MLYQYPLHLSFKIIAFGPQIRVRDANNSEVLFVHMKALRLKEDVGVFSDSKKTQQLFRIKADRIIDFSARYHFTDANGQPLGSIKREGMRSLWKASYNLMDQSEQITHTIREENPWIKVADAFFGEIPIIGMFAGYLFHPRYLLCRVGSETPVMALEKKPAFFEGAFDIQLHEPSLPAAEETRLLLSLIMMVLLERARG